MQLRPGTVKIWAGAALLALAGSAASVWQLATSREAHLVAAEQLALSLSNAAAQRAAGSLRSMDLMLMEVTGKVGDPARTDPSQIAALRAKMDALPEVDSIGLVDASGWLRHIVQRDGPPRELPVNVADAPHVRLTAEHWRDGTLLVTPPVEEKFSGRTVVLLSRPIVDPNRHFHGSAAMAMRTAFIDDALASVIPAGNDAAAMFTPGGVLYSRMPHDERFVGRSIADSAVFRAYTEAKGAGTSRLAVSFSDGRQRIVGFTPVPNYPMVAVVGIDRARILERWRREVWVHGGIQAVFVAVIFILALRLSGSERRRDLMSETLLASERAHVETLERAVSERTAELHASLDALTESEERFRRIVDISPLPLVLTRRSDSRVMYINARAAEAFGVRQEAAPGEVAPDYWVNAAEREKMVATLAAEGQVRNHEAQLMRANGEHFTALLSAANVTLQGEQLVLIAVLDITERKRLEEETARSNRDLEQFSYAVSHDLQEPLRMVSSYLTLLERRYRDKLDTEAHEFIAFAVDGAQRMSRMISDLLEYSRVHRRGNRFAPVALDDMLADALANLSTAIADSGARITAEPLPTVTGDASQLMRVLQNLIGNALKYRKADIAPELSISAAQQDGAWVVSVADNGIGIDPGHMGRLFQVFQRLHPRGAYEGSGVGLAVCRRILERHGGRIWVESDGEGLGSTFRFAIPLAPPQPADIEG